jgi:hypothetical protein
MITENPQWVEPDSFSSVKTFTPLTQLVYDHLGPIPFPKKGIMNFDLDDPFIGLDKVFQNILISPLNQEEAKSILKLSKKISKKISILKINSDKFEPTLFSNVFTSKNYTRSSHEESILKVVHSHPVVNEDCNVFQSLSNYMDDVFYAPHFMSIEATTLIHKDLLPSLDLTPCDVKEFCSQINLDPILIDFIAIDYSDDYPNHCKITIEKRIPF